MLSPDKYKMNYIFFDFAVLDFAYRVLTVEIKEILKPIDKNKNEIFFATFMEDLVWFLEQNRFQKRWDFSTIILKNINNLNLDKEQYKVFIKKLKTVTNWDMEV